MQMSPWNTVQSSKSKVERQDTQHPELVEGSGNPVQSSKSKVESPDTQHPELVEGSGDPGPQWNPLQWDAISQFYPWRVFYAHSMKSGHIPLWNPHQFSGTPFLANGQSACLYPPNLIFLVFDPITAFTIFAALHLFLAQLFMYWLMRELGARKLGGIVAAIVFAFSAFMVLWLELPTFVSAAVWLPLALLLVNRAVERRSGFHGMLAGLVLAMAFLAGHFQIAFYVVLATGLWWLWKMVGVWRAEGKTYTVLKVIWPLIGCVVIAGLIAAPQILPTQELAANSHRVRAVTEEGYQSFIANALPVYRLVTAFAPGFFGDPSQNNYYLLGRIADSSHVGSTADYMEYGMYAGILPLMLALIALGSIKKKHVGFFVVLTALALLTALGTPINRLFYFGVPGFSALGGPNRILLLYLFGIAALAGFGIDAVSARLPQGDANDQFLIIAGKRFPKKTVGVTVAAVAVSVLLGVSRVLGERAVSDEVIWATSGNCNMMVAVACSVAVVLGCLSGVLLIVWSTSRRKSFPWPVTAVAVIVLDLFAFGINYNPTCERSKVYPKTELTTELQRLTKNGERIAPLNPKWSLFETPTDSILPPNAAMVYGLYDVQGYDSLYTKAYQELMARAQGVDPSPPENGNMVLVRRNVFAGSRYYLSPAGRSFTISGNLGRVVNRLFEVDGVLISDCHCGLIGSFVTQWVSSTDGTGSGTWDGPNRVMVKAEWPYESIWVDLPYYPGWVARSEKRGQIRLRDYLFIVETPLLEGESERVSFSFEPFIFRLGLFLMLIGVGALSCVGVYRVTRHRITDKR